MRRRARWLVPPLLGMIALVDLDLLLAENFARERDLLRRMPMLERLRMLERLPLFESETDRLPVTQEEK